ncbi:MAG: DUF3857 domain-containing protein [Bacteroidales bacterium]
MKWFYFVRYFPIFAPLYPFTTMKTFFTRLFLSIGLFSILSGLRAQTDVPDARFESVVREYTLHKDGSQQYREYFSVKLLSHRAFHGKYGESFIVYNPQFQKLKINRAETVMANGRKVIAPAHAFNEVLPSWAAGSAHFSHLREMVVSHTALEVGATIFLDYQIESQADYYPFLSGAEVASLSIPAESFRVVVKVPAGTCLNYKVFNLRLAPEISKEKGFDVYSFNFGSTAAYPQESYLPGRFTFLPSVAFSTAPDLNQAVAACLLQPSTAGALPEGALKALGELNNKSNNTSALAAALRDMVASEMVTLSVKPSFTGCKMRSFKEIWESRSGTPREKAFLLAFLLQEAGFKARPVLALPATVASAEICPIGLVEDYYVILEGEGLPETVFSPTGTSSRDEKPFLYGQTLLGIGPSGKVEKNTYAPVNSEYRVEATFEMDTSANLSGTVKIKAEGLFHPYFSLNNDKNKLSSTINGMSGDKAEVSLQRFNPRKVEGTLTVSEIKLRKKGEVYLFEIPHAAAGADSWNARVLPTRRDGPFSLPAFILEEYKYILTLPEGWELITPEYQREVKRDFGGVALRMVQKGRTVEIYQALEFIEKDINLLNYPSLREILNTWYDPGLQVLMLQKK